MIDMQYTEGTVESVCILLLWNKMHSANFLKLYLNWNFLIAQIIPNSGNGLKFGK